MKRQLFIKRLKFWVTLPLAIILANLFMLSWFFQTTQWVANLAVWAVSRMEAITRWVTK